MEKKGWRTVIDAAGIERCVRNVDAREIEEQTAAIVETPKVAEAPKADIVIDDQSVAPKVTTKKK